MANKKLLGLVLGIIAVGVLLIILTAYSAESGEDRSINDIGTGEGRGLLNRQTATYVGSDNCSQCHLEIWSSWINTTHPRKIYNRSVAENASIPLPDGIKWDNVTYVIGYKWKIRYVNETGYIMTFSGANQMVAGSNMWDVAEEKWEDYHPGEDLKPYDCGSCHTTGWIADEDAATDGTLADNQDGLPGIYGTWNETGIGCEACHGPGSLHAGDGNVSNITVDTSAEQCGQCHSRAYNGNIDVVNPDRKHHEQYNDWAVSDHSKEDVNCINCHNPHSMSDSLYNLSNFMNYNTSLFSDIQPAVVMFYNETDNNASTEDYIPVSDPIELCGKCHDERVQTINHGNTTTQADCLDCHMVPSRKTINEWDIRSHTFKVYDGVTYSTDPPMNFPNLTCYETCHDPAEKIGGKIEEKFNDWSDSGHADSYHGYNGNTYCAHCMSPFEYEEMYNATNKTSSDDNIPIEAENWTSITCGVCHNLHDTPSTDNYIFNGTDYEQVKTTAEICGNCHTGSHHPEYPDWSSSAHSSTYVPGVNNNTYCSHCMSPFQSNPNHNSSTAEDIAEDDWESIVCAVCHEPHALELVLYNGSNYNKIEDISRELCGGCHSGHHTETDDWNSSVHADTFVVGVNNNTYCAHCMSPYQAGPEEEWDMDTPVLEDDWESIGCIVCHDKHSLELRLFNGSAYNPIEDISRDLCGYCHSGHHTETDDWNSSAHSNTYAGFNDNTYCAHCMSPYQGDPDATSDDNDPVGKDNWTSIGCIVCHDKHSLELAFFNGSEYEEVDDISRDLCGACHSGHHTETEDWDSSAHSDTFIKGVNNNTYCAHCMSPFQAGAEEDWDRETPVLEDDWNSIGCMVCHDKHNLELGLFNGSAFNPVEDISRDLCGACHSGHHTETEEWNSSAHANTYHGYNDNTYCAHCMSPFQSDPNANSSVNDPVGAENWTSIGCIVCHEQHSLKLSLFNGTDREDPVTKPAELCGGCHQGERHPEYPDWSVSIHASTGTMDKGNNNTFCARCHSPFQADSEATFASNKGIAPGEGTGITCTVCHQPHSLELVFFNGSAYEDVEEDPNILCSKCHRGTGEFQGAPFVINIYDQWLNSAHADTYKGYNGNTYCAHCMSPYQAGDEETQAAQETISEENWTSIGCIVCHDKHSLDLSLYNGSAYVDMEDDTNKLCGSCHTMGDATIGDEPHHSQIEMRTGIGGIDVEGSAYMPSAQCAGCHGYESNHTFHFTEAACVDCHSAKTNESALAEVESWQDGVWELYQAAEENLTFAEKAMESAKENGTWNETMNTTYYTALFNFQFVEADGTMGAHNPDYAKELLKLADDGFSDILDQVEFLPPITVSPANGAVDVPVDTVITVKFEQDINFTAFETNGYLTVSGDITGILSYDNSTYTVTFTPSADLAYDTEYTVTLSKDVMYADDSGVMLEDYAWSFTTEEEPITDITVTIGPINDENGKPIEGARVTITIDGTEYWALTDPNGMANVIIPADKFTPGVSYNITVTKDDYDDIKFEGSIAADGTFTPPTAGIPNMKESAEDKEETDYTLILIAIIIVIIIIILLVAFAMRGRGVPEEEEEVAEEEEEAEEEKEEFECPECGAIVVAGETECPECGAEFEEEAEAEEEEELPEGEEELEEEELPEGEEELGEEELPEGEEELGEEELPEGEEELEEEELPEGEEELEEEELPEGEEELGEEELEEGLEEEELPGEEEPPKEEELPTEEEPPEDEELPGDEELSEEEKLE